MSDALHPLLKVALEAHGGHDSDLCHLLEKVQWLA